MVPTLGTHMYSYISIKASLRISDSSSTGTFCASVCASLILIVISMGKVCIVALFIPNTTSQQLRAEVTQVAFDSFVLN